MMNCLKTISLIGLSVSALQMEQATEETPYEILGANDEYAILRFEGKFLGENNYKFQENNYIILIFGKLVQPNGF